jgi:hypothetical protein
LPRTRRPRACRNGVLSAPDQPPAATLGTWPTEKVQRPLALPRGTWSLGAAAAYSGQTVTGGVRHAAGITASVAVSPLCNLELGVQTAHALTPPVPFVTVVPSVTLALTRFTAATLGADLFLQPSVDGSRSATVWLGTPVRLRIVDWLALVGADRLLTVSTAWGGANSGTQLSFGLPVGLLFQPLPRLSLEAKVAPVVLASPFSFSRLDVFAEALFAPLRTFDVIVSGYLSPRADTTVLVVSAGVAVRL